VAFKEYSDCDACGLADLVRKKQVNPRDLLDEAIARTSKVDPQVNAVVIKHYDYAERQIGKGLPAGPFSGPPFLLKDRESLEGTRTTSGSSVYREHVRAYTSTLARRFLAAVGMECGRAAARHDVRGGLWRRSDFVSAGRPARARTAMEEKDAAHLCLTKLSPNRERASLLFAAICTIPACGEQKIEHR
jgi:amidase